MTSDDQVLRTMLAASAVDVDALFAAGPHGLEVPVADEWIHDWLPEGRWNLAPSLLVERLATWAPQSDGALVMVPRRDGSWNNSIRYGRSKDPAIVHLHPDDAAAIGIDESALVEITSANGTLTSAVNLDETLRRGVISIGHGRFKTSPGVLTSSTAEVDGATAMPLMSGVRVTVRADG